MLSVINAECYLNWVSYMLSVIYAECHLCWVSFMLSGIYSEYHNKPFMLKCQYVERRYAQSC